MRALRIVGLCAAVVTTLGPIVFVAPAGADAGVPYTDPDAVGYIGLCNQAGQQITGGDIDTAPFAWRAVSSQPAPVSYSGPTRTAILLAYQPLMGLAPSDWSGDELTASARDSNPAAPTAAATSADESLAQYMLEFKPDWDGFLQLRMYLGAANEQQYSVQYPALNIQVTGQTWQVVGGGPVDCNSGAAESIESILLPTTTTTTQPPASTGRGAATRGARAASGVSGSSPAHPDTNTVTTYLGVSVASSTESDGSDVGAWVVVATVLVVGALALALILVRRRRADPSSDDPPSPNSVDAPTFVGASSMKGTPE